MFLRKELLITLVTLVTLTCSQSQTTSASSSLQRMALALPIVGTGPPSNTSFTQNTQFNAPKQRAPPVYTKDEIANFRRISLGAQQFALELLTKFSDAVSSQAVDIMLSPFAIWSLLLLLAEGANGETRKQLQTTLHLDDDLHALRRAYRFVETFLTANTSTIEVAALQALFTDVNQPVNRDFEQILENDYGATLIPVDFHNPKATYDIINSEVNKATRGLIPYAINPKDLEDANLFMMSSLYFKGQWNKPFNRSLTRTEPFYDIDGNSIGNVEMMTQEGHFVYTGINELEAHVLELPYGTQNRLSMLILLPKKGITLNKVVHNLKNFGFEMIFTRLAAAEVNFEDEDIEVFLPQWSTSSGFTLNGILEELGIKDVFDSTTADLSNMADKLYVSRIIHHTRIIVNEEGTTAAATTSAVFANKSTPPKFYLNRPFLYLIMEKSSNLLLFAGQVQNPNKIKS